MTIAALSVGLLVAVLAIYAARSNLAGSGVASEAEPAQAVASTAAPVEIAPLASASASVPLKKPLGVNANALIARLSIAGTSIEIAKPTRKLEVPLTPLQRKAEIAVEAVAVDGRRVAVNVAGDTENLEITFPAPVPLAQPKPPVRHSPPKRPEPPGLAPTPYGNP